MRVLQHPRQKFPKRVKVHQPVYLYFNRHQHSTDVFLGGGDAETRHMGTNGARR